jgi:hypothetical protein
MFNLASSVFGLLGRGGGQLQPRKLSGAEQRYQSAQPFDAIRQQLMAQGVSATPELMQSYQDQAASQKGKPIGGIMGKRSVTGGPMGGDGPSPLSGPNPFGAMANKVFAKRRASMEGRARVRGPWGAELGFGSAYEEGLRDPGKAAKMPGGSFYQQSLSGTSLKDWKWNRTARAGTQSYQSGF